MHTISSRTENVLSISHLNEYIAAVDPLEYAMSMSLFIGWRSKDRALLDKVWNEGISLKSIILIYSSWFVTNIRADLY